MQIKGYCESGNWKPSVTSIIRIAEDKAQADRLRKWEKKMAKVKGYEGAAEEVRQLAADRGTATHQVIEWFLNGKIREKDLIHAASQQKSIGAAYSVSALPLLNVLKGKIIATELYVSHPRYAGRLDTMAVWDNEHIVVLDWKTTDKPKRREWMHNCFLQLAAYAIAYNESLADDSQRIGKILAVSLRQDGYSSFLEDLEPWIEPWFKTLDRYEALTANQQIEYWEK